MNEIVKLIGKKIVAIKGQKYNYDRYNSNAKTLNKHVEPEYIFFDDEESYIELQEQDYYSYHDCSSSARHIYIYKDKEKYKNLINSEHLTDTNTDL